MEESLVIFYLKCSILSLDYFLDSFLACKLLKSISEYLGYKQIVHVEESLVIFYLKCSILSLDYFLDSFLACKLLKSFF